MTAVLDVIRRPARLAREQDAFPLVIFDAVRGAFPPEKPVSVRVSGTDWVNGGWDVEQTIVFARKLEERGCDAIDVSSGVRAPKQYLRSQPRRLKDLFLESE